MLRKLLFSAIVINLIEVSVLLDCGPNQEVLNEQRCCTSCAPGEGVRSTCSELNDTECEPCRIGEMYSKVYSHLETCRPCRICSAYSHVIFQCNTTHDTECECDDNYFLDRPSNRCRMCDLCPEGYGVKKTCTSQHNTVCWPCPEGTFSDSRSEMGCRVCSACTDNEIQIQGCTSRRNTICVAIPQPTVLVYGVGSTPLSITPESDSAHRLQLIPVYCSALGLVVLGLLVYVVVKSIQRKNAAASSSSQKGGQYSSVTDLQPSPTIVTSNGDSYMQQNTAIYLEQDLRPITGSTRVRDLAPVRHKALATLLLGPSRDNPQGQAWWALGNDLGYSTSRLSDLEVHAINSGNSPALCLIADWGNNNRQATVAVLVRALHNIGRDDIVRMLATDMKYSTAGSVRGNMV